jgi:hypothetical protein
MLGRVRGWVARLKSAAPGDAEAPGWNVTVAAGAAKWQSGESRRDVLGRAKAGMYADKPALPVTAPAS